jgi:flavin-dependent dehydrogenase
MKHKVAIIGGGVIGMYIGWKLSEKGNEVTLFEQKEKEVADFKCCSGLVSQRVKDFIPIEDEVIKNVIDHCEIIFPKKNIRLSFNPPHLALDREAMMRCLISLNERAGTILKFGMRVEGIPSGFDKVIVCNGANSIQRGEGISFRLGAQLLVKKDDHSHHVETYPIRSGFCWKIPRGSMVEYGIMTNSRILKKEFDIFLKRMDIDIGSGKFYSAAIPKPRFSHNPLSLGDGETFFCGDAIGLTKPWSGGGIIWGLTAADILINNLDSVGGYRREVNKKFRYHIIKGHISNGLVNWAGVNIPLLLPSEVAYDNDFPNILKSLKSLIKRGKGANL